MVYFSCLFRTVHAPFIQILTSKFASISLVLFVTAFFTATQFFFTLSFTIGLLACIAVVLFNFLCPADKEILALKMIGGGLCLAGKHHP